MSTDINRMGGIGSVSFTEADVSPLDVSEIKGVLGLDISNNDGTTDLIFTVDYVGPGVSSQYRVPGGASLNIQLRRFNTITIIQPSLSYDIITKVDYD